VHVNLGKHTQKNTHKHATQGKHAHVIVFAVTEFLSRFVLEQVPIHPGT